MRIFQAWGMTETSPVATFSRPQEGEHDEAYWDARAKQGRPLPWVELRLIDDDGEEVAWDGESTGEIEVRGPWIAARYFNDESGDEKFDAGWLRTGDIAAVDADGFVQITDRAKDVIKSGGEWISSVELENEMMSHPDVVEAAVIAKPDERWAERPLCCVVLREGASTTAPELVEHLRGRVAKWWLPDEFAFLAGDPQDERGQVRQEGAARRPERGHAGRARARVVSSRRGLCSRRAPAGRSLAGRRARLKCDADTVDTRKMAASAISPTGAADRPFGRKGRPVPANGELMSTSCD